MRSCRVVRNLFDNAERHAAGRDPSRGASGPTSGTVLTVANDGPAIPEEERERIFEPFMRLDEARSLDIGGSGLGLAIARSIMTALGGSIVAVGGRPRSRVQGVVPGSYAGPPTSDLRCQAECVDNVASTSMVLPSR